MSHEAEKKEGDKAKAPEKAKPSPEGKVISKVAKWVKDKVFNVLGRTWQTGRVAVGTPFNELVAKPTGDFTRNALGIEPRPTLLESADAANLAVSKGVGKFVGGTVQTGLSWPGRLILTPFKMLKGFWNTIIRGKKADEGEASAHPAPEGAPPPAHH